VLERLTHFRGGRVILVIDVGNTETTLGVFEGETLRAHWRVTTEPNRTPDELGLQLRALLDAAELPRARLGGAAIGSVVPALTDALVAACANWLGVRPIVVDARAALPIRLEVDEPLTVGADRIINTLAASKIYGRDTIVVDLGTATTFDCITAKGAFLGGIIAPGLRTSMDTLIRRTSKLPATELVPPTRAIATRTEECIRAGVFFGAADSIDGLVRRIKAEWPGGEEPLVVATGGLAELIASHCQEIDRTEPTLTLIGLRLAYDLLA
jgi:type III pantothenate kinase